MNILYTSISHEVQSTEQRRAAIGATLAEYAEDAPGRVREATQRGVGLGTLAFQRIVMGVGFQLWFADM